MWVGDAAGERLGSSWTPGWEAVAIKKVQVGHFATRELTALTRVQHRIQELERHAERAGQQPEEPHVIQLLSSYPVSLAGQDYQMFVTK